MRGRASNGRQGTRVMIRNAIRATAISLATLAVPALFAAAPATATASPSGAGLSTTLGVPLCEVHNFPNRCVGSANLDLYTSVRQSKVGRHIAILCDSTDTNCIIKFTGAKNRCVAASVSTPHAVDIKQCSGTNGIIWIVRGLNGSGDLQFISKYWRDHGNHCWYLEGDGVRGDRFRVYPKASGRYSDFLTA